MPQSSGQLVQLSSSLQTMSPQPMHTPQSGAHVAHVSPAPHSPSPQLGPSGGGGESGGTGTSGSSPSGSMMPPSSSVMESVDRPHPPSTKDKTARTSQAVRVI
jgi:hypothetical protein